MTSSSDKLTSNRNLFAGAINRSNHVFLHQQESLGIVISEDSQHIFSYFTAKICE